MASAVRNANDKDLIQRVLGSLRHNGPGDPGMTSQELADKVGMDVKRVRDWIRAELAAGRLARGWRPIEGIDGRNTRTPVYAVKK
jgi:hypothetical protein